MRYHFEICERNELGEPWPLCSCPDSSDVIPLMAEMRRTYPGLPYGRLLARKVWH